MAGRARLFLITGDPGVGKTTVVQKVINSVRAQGYAVGGMLTREIRAKGERRGFELMDILSGEKGTLASTSLGVGPRLGKYKVSLNDLASIGVKSLLQALETCDLIVCDEVGPMELLSPDFRRAVKTVIEGNKPLLAVVHKRLKEPIIVELKSLPEAELFEVTPANREGLSQLLTEKILLRMRGYEYKGA